MESTTQPRGLAVPTAAVIGTVVLIGTLFHVWLHQRVHGVYNVTHIGLAFFLVINVLIAWWEIALFVCQDQIQAEYEAIKEPYRGARAGAHRRSIRAAYSCGPNALAPPMDDDLVELLAVRSRLLGPPFVRLQHRRRQRIHHAHPGTAVRVRNDIRAHARSRPRHHRHHHLLANVLRNRRLLLPVLQQQPPPEAIRSGTWCCSSASATRCGSPFRSGGCTRASG